MLHLPDAHSGMRPMGYDKGEQWIPPSSLIQLSTNSTPNGTVPFLYAGFFKTADTGQGVLQTTSCPGSALMRTR